MALKRQLVLRWLSTVIDASPPQLAPVQGDLVDVIDPLLNLLHSERPVNDSCLDWSCVLLYDDISRTGIGLHVVRVYHGLCLSCADDAPPSKPQTGMFSLSLGSMPMVGASASFSSGAGTSSWCCPNLSMHLAVCRRRALVSRDCFACRCSRNQGRECLCRHCTRGTGSERGGPSVAHRLRAVVGAAVTAVAALARCAEALALVNDPLTVVWSVQCPSLPRLLFFS